jgi:3'(2'), 5'-bisphosphate nucleotidase
MEKISVRKVNENDITIAGSRSHGNQKQQSFISKIKNVTVLSVGSSKKFCLVAEGKADIYPRFGSTSEWDTAAAQCIVEESGGKVIDEGLNPIKYNTKSSLINPSFFVIGDTSFNWNKFIT